MATYEDCETMLESLKEEIELSGYPVWLGMHYQQMQHKLYLVGQGEMKPDLWEYKFKLGCDVAKAFDFNKEHKYDCVVCDD